MGLIILILLVGTPVLLVMLARMRERMERLEGEVAALRVALEEGRRVALGPADLATDVSPAPPSVIPAKAGISGQEVSAGLPETPAFAGVTAWGSRHA